ncbi:MAG: hypothetical protein F4X21_10200 [Acidimicrobiia bacterium]|nr:hypothetical protein [Acidimicrobiia bacterium]
MIPFRKATPSETIAEVLRVADEVAHMQTDGKWLEAATVLVGPLIREWDLAECHLWPTWPNRTKYFPKTTEQDIGIDVVGIRRSDGRHIAIQCKSRQLDEQGMGRDITKHETDKFAAVSADDFWAERWIVTNGAVRLSRPAIEAHSMIRPIKLVNLVSDLRYHQSIGFDHGDTDPDPGEDCPHCTDPSEPEPRQSKSCMQNDCVNQSVRILREHAASNSGGLPVGQARGRIILPCGTGKTRISLRIVEQLTPMDGLSIVLCPSIALVAQIRREYLQHAEQEMRVLAVCSDQTAGYDPKQEERSLHPDDPTRDKSNFSASAVKGEVTTDPKVIAEWITDDRAEGRLNVIFGTYQSGSRIAEALKKTGQAAKVLVADEAHRTAGLRRNAKVDEQRLRDFTLCHDNDAFPATYRVYQTATPRIYNVRKVQNDQPSDWIVRSMDDELTFGVELFRKSYGEAVKNEWLSDYRIIALGVNDPQAYELVNRLAQDTKSKGRRKLTSSDYLRGLAFALAMGGATHQERSDSSVPIRSCIAFMNTVDKSKNMAADLQSESVKAWLQDWLDDNQNGQVAADYRLEHLDASSNVVQREQAKLNLTEGSVEVPHGIINVGIFGEGTDSPSLNAVAFLEARKSPIDVIQAVGRAMRIAPDKQVGYIICPILIPPNADPETWLSVSGPEDGWRELGQILLALRAHDSRIEDELANLMEVYLPSAPEYVTTIIAIGDNDKKRIEYHQHTGRPGTAAAALERVLENRTTIPVEFEPISDPPDPSKELADFLDMGSDPQTSVGDGESSGQPADRTPPMEPTQILSGKRHEDGSIEIRLGSVERQKPKSDGTRGRVDIDKSKKTAWEMLNRGAGIRVKTPVKQPTQVSTTCGGMGGRGAPPMLDLTGLSEYGNAIRMNLLSKSGLTDNRVMRDLNLLESGVREAAFHLRSDQLGSALDKHFGLENLKPKNAAKQTDGCTIAALLMMNAAMLHQRIAAGRWLRQVEPLDEVKNATDVIERLKRNWSRIVRQDFLPVIEPAQEAIFAVEETGRLSGLERALRHLVSEAQYLAETYADMGADHAGPLFNKVMGNQASDGAFFTRPPAATIAARLALEASGARNRDWTDPQTWRDHKTVDLACGSGTLLTAVLTEMKRRAGEQGATEAQIAARQRVGVEEVLKGMDINPVSLQLAATQLTTGNRDVKYRGMGLYLMPYGPTEDPLVPMAAGTLELIAEDAVIPQSELEMFQSSAQGSALQAGLDDPEVERAAQAAMNARIVIMNPPFTNRSKMGEKYPKAIQKMLHRRTDSLEERLVGADSGLKGFVDKNSLRPLFVALAKRCISEDQGVLAMVCPTITLTAPSGDQERRVLAERFQVHTILTCHHPGNINLSQNTSINESLLVLCRSGEERLPTRIIALDRFPVDDQETAALFEALQEREVGVLADGWGEVSEWPAELIGNGDWSAGAWRSPDLAEASARFFSDESLQPLYSAGLSPHATGQQLRGAYRPSTAGGSAAFPILKSKGAEGQRHIESEPDEHWEWKQEGDPPILDKAGYLLITAGQDTSTGRLTAVASDKTYVGNGWMPVTGHGPNVAKAVAVWINSTPGRLLLMRNPGRKLTFPAYSADSARRLPIPDISDPHIKATLAECWEATCHTPVPQFRDGECEVRQLWDKAVCEALGWDEAEIASLRKLLHAEPHVRGLAYGQYAG